MAIKYAARWRPHAYRSTTEAIILSGDPPSRVQVLQLVVFDDTQVASAGNAYRPGDPATEQYLTVVDEVPIQMAVTAFTGLTNTQSRNLWNTARDNQIAAWQADPIIAAKVSAAIGGALSPHIVIG